MTYFLSLVLIILNSIFAFGKRHSKIVCLLLVSFMWIIFWGNVKNPDYTAYLKSYNNIGTYGTKIISTTSAEMGYRYLIKFFSYFNVHYNEFLLIISFVGLLLINSTIEKYTDNSNYVYLLYFIFPFLIDIIQVRNFLAISIIIFAIRYLITQKKGNKIKYIIAVLLATTIHYTAFMYLPLIFINKKNKNIIIKLLISFSTLGCLCMLFVNDFIPKMSNLICTLLGDEKYKIYFMRKTRYGYLLYFGTQIFSFFMISIAKKIWQSNQQNNAYAEDNTENYSFIEFVYWVNIYLFAFFPLYILNSNFTRFMRNVQLLYFISFSIASDSFNEKSKNKVLFNILVVVYILFMFFLFIYLHGKNDILNDILRYNLFFT